MQLKNKILAKLYINGKHGLNVTTFLKENTKVDFEEFIKCIKQINYEFVLTNQCLKINRYDMLFILEVDADVIEEVVKNTKKIINLSPINMEILAIISQNPNITRPEINKIRGVSSDIAIKKLIENGFVRISGKDPSKANSKTLALDVEFYKYFNIQTLEDLPKLEKINFDEFEENEIEFLSNKFDREDNFNIEEIKTHLNQKTD